MQEATVIIIGGGATGTGILRDLCMRGIKAILLEQGDLAAGTSSRFHGLLHSGCRYAVNDQAAASECITENTILRRIGGFCVENTEGYFIRTPDDDPAYEAKWLAGCKASGINVQEISPDEARRREPNITPLAQAVYRVPDAAIDGFRVVWHNAMSARRYGGEVYTYRKVTEIKTENGHVRGVTTEHALTGEKEEFYCDYLVNAAGSWAGQIAHMAGLTVNVAPDRGTLLAFNHRFTDRIISRLRKSGDGDIFVPHGSITIFGTTSIPTDRPNDTTPTSEEVFYLLGLGEALFPQVRDFRMLRAFAGTRPLYSPDASTGRAATRNFVILDHSTEGLHGMASITGGKFTTFRMMAEKMSNVVAAALGNTNPCRTAEESIIPEPPAETVDRARKVFPAGGVDLATARLGDGLEHAVRIAETTAWKKLLLCECELVTMAEFESVASEESSHSLGDIRRRTRLGMGTCQGSFCALRATGALVEGGLLRQRSPQELFRQFLQERWNGIRPLLWGHQLREIELERGIYGATLNIDGACGPVGFAPKEPMQVCTAAMFGTEDITALKASSPAPSHLTSTTYTSPPASPARAETPKYHTSTHSLPEHHCDVVIVGAGFAGLVAAVAAAGRGRKTMLISKGGGALVIGGGTIDLLGYLGHDVILGDPFAAMHQLPPEHPYQLLGTDAVRASLAFLQKLAADAGTPMTQVGDTVQGNAWLPTASGTMKPTWLTGPAMNPERLAEATSYTVVGFTGMKDFSPHLVAAGLQHCPHFGGKKIDCFSLASPLPQAANAARDGNTLDIARFVDTPEGLAWLAKALKQAANGAEAVLIPAILGTKTHPTLHRDLEKATGLIVTELFCPPPSVTGLRMLGLLRDNLRNKHMSYAEGAVVTEAIVKKGHCEALVTTATDTKRVYHAESFIIATGGIFSDGIITAPGEAHERIFGIPVAVPTNPDGPARQEDWSCPQFFGRDPHAFATMGVRVNENLIPVDPSGDALFDNVFCAGRIIGGYDYATEKSGSGVALATGFHAGMKA